MKKRPLAITIIAWTVIILKVIAVLTFAVMHYIDTGSLSAVFSKLGLKIGLFIELFCAVGMLKGKNWSRYLFVTWDVLWGALVVSVVGMQAILNMAVFFVAAIFLFTPKANRYFKNKPTEERGTVLKSCEQEPIIKQKNS